MKVSIIALLMSTAIIAQEDCDLQYDGNGDGAVNVEDVLGVLSEFSEVCADTTDETSNFPCGESLEYFGYTYETVEVFGECWFAENLRNTSYNNGDPIPGDLSDFQWSSTSEGAQAVYDNSNNFLLLQGRLYNWYAVNDERGVCPTGWHVPSDAEFMDLEIDLGMSYAEAESTGYRGNSQGVHLKAHATDVPSFDGSNETGWSGSLTRHRDIDGDYLNTLTGYWWTQSVEGSYYAWRRYLGWEQGGVGRTAEEQRMGFAVRCIKD